MADVVNYLESHPGLFVAIGGIATVLGVVVSWIIAYFRWKKAQVPAPASSSAPAKPFLRLLEALRSRKKFWLLFAVSSAVVLSVVVVLLWPKGGDEPASPPPDPTIGQGAKEKNKEIPDTKITDDKKPADTATAKPPVAKIVDEKKPTDTTKPIYNRDFVGRWAMVDATGRNSAIFTLKKSLDAQSSWPPEGAPEPLPSLRAGMPFYDDTLAWIKTTWSRKPGQAEDYDAMSAQGRKAWFQLLSVSRGVTKGDSGAIQREWAQWLLVQRDGKWEVVGSEARITWNTGWKDILRPQQEQDSVLKLALAPGASWSDSPSNASRAIPFPSIDGDWREVDGKEGKLVTIVQKDDKFTAESSYQTPNDGIIRWRMTGTISKEGAISGSLVHLKSPKTYADQTRTATLSAGGDTISGRAVFRSEQHDFTWRKEK